MRYSIILLLLAFLPQSVYSQLRPGEIIISPGIKVGGSSGDEGGVTIGFELSVTQMFAIDRSYQYIGFVLDYDYATGGRHKIHAGVESGFGFVGMEIGPTLVFGQGEPRMGLTVTPYVGLFLIPYYSITFFDPVIHEAGVYGKAPLKSDGSQLRFH